NSAPVLPASWPSCCAPSPSLPPAAWWRCRICAPTARASFWGSSNERKEKLTRTRSFEPLEEFDRVEVQQDGPGSRRASSSSLRAVAPVAAVVIPRPMRHHDLCNVADEVGAFLVTVNFCHSNPFLDGFDALGQYVGHGNHRHHPSDDQLVALGVK